MDVDTCGRADATQRVSPGAAIWLFGGFFDCSLVGGVFGLVDGEFGEGGLPEVVGEAGGFEVEFAVADALAELAVGFFEGAVLGE